MKYKYIIIIAVIASLFFASCKEEWDDHYYNKVAIKSELNLYDYISTKSGLSIFAKMLQIAGYDTILARPQTYTVWAPVDESLADVDLTDTTAVLDIVKNHISRFSHPTSGVEAKTIFMIDRKFLLFQKTASGFTFGGKQLIESNIATSNGILHMLDGYVPYLSNIWEFIGKTPGLDSLRAYLYSQNVNLFDKSASIEIGTNEFNQAIYDSVIIFSNPVLDRIGHLHVEDSIFGAILPDNKAWASVYNQIKSNYKTLAKDGGAAQQRLNTQMAIVQNLVFKFKSMDVEPHMFDSLWSTTGSVFNPSSYLFEGAGKHVLSNGLAYVTDSIRFRAVDSWQKPIIVEAENSSYGRSYLYASLYIRSSLGSSYSVSDNKYLVCEPTTVSKSTPNSVTFPIPNTLSGKYKIYCVFVPTNIVSPESTRRYKVKFNLSYINSAGAQVTNATITANNGISTAVGANAAIFTTDTAAITKMYVTQIDFPFCNIYTSKSSPSDITVKLKVENATQITETVNFDPNLRIDYIILEPVQ